MRDDLRTGALMQLSELSDYEVAERHYDVRGWDVHASGGEKLGEVTDLLVDISKLKVRYLAVRLDAEAAAGRHVLLPIGLAKLDGARRAVLIDSLSQQVILALPRYEGGEVSRERETTLRATLQAAIPAGDFYEHPHFDESGFYGDYRHVGRSVLRRRDAAAEQAPSFSRLKNMEDFEVAAGSPDVRGWKVVGAEGTKVGKVEDFLVDTAAKKVRYLEVDIEGAGVAGAGRALLPIGLAIVDHEDEIVFVPEIGAAAIKRLPPYRGEPVDRAYERAVLEAIPPRQALPASTHAFYDSRYFDDRQP
jgi:photosynthetic reaction center H subunit